MIILGITGTIGAGKGTIVGYLEDKGFTHYSAREFIVTEIEKRGMPVTRDSMVIVANDIRTNHSPSYIIEKLSEDAERAGRDAVIESIRTGGEVDALRTKNNFYLLAADADPKIRYARIVARGNETDHISFEKFLADESREMNSADPNKQNLSLCMSRADYRITNNGTVEELRAQIDHFIDKIQRNMAQATRN